MIIHFNFVKKNCFLFEFKKIIFDIKVKSIIFSDNLAYNFTKYPHLIDPTIIDI